MSKNKKRVYHSETRDAQAALTRKRILEVAKNLFATAGFEFVTIERIAKEAKVSIPTVYSLFQSKRGILRELMDEALPNEEHAALVEKSMQSKCSKDRLLMAAKISRVLYDAERTQMELFQGASVLAPEFKELEKEREMRRHKRLEETIRMIEKEKSFLKGLTTSKAHDILWAFTGRDLYRMFVIEQEWSSDEYEKWLGLQLLKTLLDGK